MPVSPESHFLQRGKRDLSADQQLGNSKKIYQLELSGSKLHLHLVPQSEFIAPGLVFQYLDHNRTWLNDSEPYRHCYHSGVVNEHSDSKATLSICDYMHGTFRIGNEQYFIEPHPDHRTVEGPNKPHIVYKWDSLPQIQKESESCHTQTDTLHVSSKPGEDINPWEIHRHLKRHRRSVSREQFVETMVVADASMVQYHGNSLHEYLLVVMAIVADLYRDVSIGNNINIVVVKILILKNESDGPIVTTVAAKTLKEFCMWQYKQNNMDDDDVGHYDTAVLLTRKDICRSPTKCDTLGLAELGTMCNPRKSCSITEDNGVSAAYTIAHELGHVFSLPHDTNQRCRQQFIDQRNGIYHMMSPTLYQGTRPWSWSDCSRHILTQFLDAGYGDCLLDKPINLNYTSMMQNVMKILPGQKYDVHRQCQMVYGNNTKLCPYMPGSNSICHDLWCQEPNGACMTEHMPWADGTPCGDGKWCMKFRCITKEDTKLMHGGWSEWGKWGPCSRTCGGGITKRIRTCTDPEPRFGGSYCLGDRAVYKSCNHEACPPGQPDFREKQCEKHTNMLNNYANLPKTFRFVPKYSGIHMKDRCKLFCRVSGSHKFFLVSGKVKDGTKCGKDTFDVCVNGKCRKAGCDNILGSNQTLDRCGNCGGDNSTCLSVSNNYHKPVHYGYNYVATIPAGASELDIRQHGFKNRVDDNYLAVQDRSSKFLLNGYMVVTYFKKIIPVAGAALEYSGSNRIMERVNCSGRIKQTLYVYVLAVGDLRPPNISYHFVKSFKPRFRWYAQGPFKPCSRMCQGMQSRQIVCTRTNDGKIVRGEHCKDQPKPKSVTRACNRHCSLRWRVVEEGECSGLCGQNGTLARKVKCEKQDRQTMMVEHKHCEHLTDKPPEVLPCVGKCEESHWEYTLWDKCSKSCGGGVQVRSVTCVDMSKKKVPEHRCEAEKKMLEQKCNTQPCPVWSTGQWSGCSVTCGPGKKYRRISCLEKGLAVSKTRCDGDSEPERSVECNLGECPVWKTDDWGGCSVTCGAGEQSRYVYCISADGDVLEEAECDAIMRPRDRQECYLSPCPTVPRLTTPPMPIPAGVSTKWRTGSWTACSTTCGPGTRRRYVSCRGLDGKIANDSECNHSPQPPPIERCIVKPCGQWRTGDWTSCSVTCGEGKETRYVACVLPNILESLISDAINCDVKIQPDNKRTCNKDPCVDSKDFPVARIINNRVEDTLKWRAGPWSACPTSCGIGWQERRVVCHSEKGPSDKCDPKLKPQDKKSCHSGPCPVWKATAWRKCSVSCGGGLRYRNVTCELPGGKVLSDHSCPIRKRPQERQYCSLTRCPQKTRWKAGKWSKCTAKCGKGYEFRNVTCEDDRTALLNDSSCHHQRKPKTSRVCRRGRCPKWKAKAWGYCSATCGEGHETREVICRIPRQGPVDEAKCSLTDKPPDTRPCNITDCINYAWKTSHWSKCTKSCGAGLKLRKVMCVRPDTQETVPDVKCRRKPRPRGSRGCMIAPCPYSWHVEQWSECSKTCDVGQRTRNVSCRAFSPEGWLLDKAIPERYCDPENKPPSVAKCNRGSCNDTHVWSTSDWGPCSSTCGTGRSRRKVLCIDVFTNESNSRRNCLPKLKPRTTRHCYLGPCYSSSCTELKKLSRLRRDGDYHLLIKGTLIKIYCKGMNRRSQPAEYLSLPAGELENYSEIYHKRLRDSSQCPQNGTRDTECPDCFEDEPYNKSGRTMFSKIRLNITSLQVIVEDTTFAKTSDGAKVPYATAGDCYSSKPCPQGEFKINLEDTGFQVSPKTSWELSGHKTAKTIGATLSKQIVQGVCGGRCGRCSPHTDTGLQLRVVP